MFALLGITIAYFFVDSSKEILLSWLGGLSIPCVFSTVIISFITLKGVILTIDHNKYAGLKLLQDNPREKKRFYSHFDACIYSALCIIIINILYLLIATLNINFLNKLFIVSVIGATFYIISPTTTILLII